MFGFGGISGPAPVLASTLNIAVFNLCNATGAWFGAGLLNAGVSLRALPALAAAVAAGALAIAGADLAVEHRASRRRAAASAAQVVGTVPSSTPRVDARG